MVGGLLFSTILLESVATSSNHSGISHLKTRRISFLSPWVWIAFAASLLIGTPFYWPPDMDALVLGIPLWVLVALLSSFSASCLSAWLFLKHWPEEDDQDDG